MSSTTIDTTWLLPGAMEMFPGLKVEPSNNVFMKFIKAFIATIALILRAPIALSTYMAGQASIAEKIAVALGVILIVWLVLHMSFKTCPTCKPAVKKKFASILDDATAFLGFQKNTVTYYHWKDCGHCKEFDPEWKLFKERMEQEFPAVIVRDLEVTRDTDAIEKDGVNAFPTIKFNDEEIEFEGGQRTADALYDIVSEKL